MNAFGIIFLLLAVYLVSVHLFARSQEQTLGDFFGAWEYGVCRSRVARRHRIFNRVEFLMLDQGKNQHWYPFASKFWDEFKLDEKQKPKGMFDF